MTEQNSNSCPTSPIIWWWHRMGTARTWAKGLLAGVRFWGDEREQSIHLSSNISATEGPACTRALQEGWKALINKHMGGGERGLCKLKWSQQGRSTESSFFTNANHLGIGQRTVRWSKLWEGHVQICKRRCVSSAHLQEKYQQNKSPKQARIEGESIQKLYKGYALVSYWCYTKLNKPCGLK